MPTNYVIENNKKASEKERENTYNIIHKQISDIIKLNINT